MLPETHSHDVPEHEAHPQISFVFSGPDSLENQFQCTATPWQVAAAAAFLSRFANFLLDRSIAQMQQRQPSSRIIVPGAKLPHVPPS